MISLKKEIKDVLKVFSNLSNSTISNDNKDIVIVLVENKTLTLISENVDCLLLYKTQIESDDNFMVNWDIKQLCSLVEKLNCDIKIDENGVYTNTGKYTFSSKEIGKTRESIKELVEAHSIRPSNKISFVDYEKINVAKSFLGKEVEKNKDYTCIVLHKNKLLSNNGTTIYRDDLSNLKDNDIINISEQLFVKDSIIKGLGDKSNKFNICLYDNESAFWSLENETLGLNIYIYHKYNQEIPDLDAEGFRQLYDHRDSFLFNAKEFCKKLDVIMIGASSNPNNKINLRFNVGKLYIENKENNNNSFDSVDCKYSECFENEFFPVDGRFVLQIVSLFEGMVKAFMNLDMPVIRFVDMEKVQEEDKRLILYARLKKLQSKENK